MRLVRATGCCRQLTVSPPVTPHAQNVVVLPRFRTPHGSHTVAFLGEVPALTVPWDVATALPKRTRAQTAADKDAVRTEAVEDIFLLSTFGALAGQASSHFSVFARLLGGAGVASVFYGDWEEVSSGKLANGFFHGQLNTTFALHVPEQRMKVVLARLLNWPVTPRDEPISLSSETLLPNVPKELFRRLSPGWRGEADAARHCNDELADPAEMVNDGADFYTLKNWEMAWACWHRAAQHAKARLMSFIHRCHELRGIC